MREVFIVERGTADGEPYERHVPLGIPLAWAKGHLEAVSDRALRDMVTDIQHEQHRRAGTLAKLGGWDPDKTQKRGH